MRFSIPLSLALALATNACCSETSAVLAAPVSLQPDRSLPGLSWLSGTWVSVDEHTEEHWSYPRGGTMMGYAHSAHAGRRLHYEHLRIDEEDGTVRYHADPVGQAATVFTLTAREKGRLVFENPEHDYPQRIEYRRRSPGQLEIVLTGIEDGEPKSVTIEMWRVEPPVCAE